MFKLVISDDEGKTIIVPLVRDLITVGRQEGNTIRLTERNVSRQHARLVRGDGMYRVEDVDSYNGVSVNGQRIDKQRDLKDGDRVSIGDYTITIKAADAEAGTNPGATLRTSGPPSTSVPPARLVMVSAPAPGAEFSVSKPAVRIGRLEELDLCISHRSVSREHAKIAQKDGSFEIEDLNSANGVRINGSGIKRGALKSGDIVELGQVRFRFVGPGESYVFDPSDEELLSLPRGGLSGPRRRTIVGIAFTAAVVGGALAAIQDGGAASRAPEQPVVRPEPVVTSGNAPDLEVKRQIDAALEGCRTALAAERFDDAVRAAQNGLALADGDEPLLECRNEAEERRRVASAIELGKQAYVAGQFEEAFAHFAKLPEGDPARALPEVAMSATKVAAQRLLEARRLLRTSPVQAERTAQTILEMAGFGVPEVTIQEAQRIVFAARKAPGTAPAAPPRVAKENSSGAAAQQARDCLARGDQRCAVRALEGNAQTAQELALLIETYRALGETQKAVKNMTTFVDRFPEARQTAQYRQFIVTHAP